MYKSDIQFIREKYRELADENNKLREELKKRNTRWYRPDEIVKDVLPGEILVAVYSTSLFKYPTYASRAVGYDYFEPFPKFSFAVDWEKEQPLYVMPLPKLPDIDETD